MAEEITDTIQNIEETETQVQEDMDLVTGLPVESVATESAADLPNIADKPSENGGAKRGREEEEDDEDKGVTKKPNLERSVEEERLEEVEGKGMGGEDREEEEVKVTAEFEEVRKEEKDPEAANVGPKMFCSSVEMFEYFHKLLHDWPTNLNINKYEYIVLVELLKKGHVDAGKKIGEGIEAFQVRYHPEWKSRCFFLLRTDGSVDDFSFRKCVDHILPLPDNMKVPFTSSNGNKAWGKQKGGGGGGGGGSSSSGRGSHGRGGRGGRGCGSRGR